MVDIQILFQQDVFFLYESKSTLMHLPHTHYLGVRFLGNLLQGIQIRSTAYLL